MDLIMAQYLQKNLTPEQRKAETEYKIRETQSKIDELKLQLQVEEDKKKASIYKVTLLYLL